jgi:hypothetical protein
VKLNKVLYVRVRDREHVNNGVVEGAVHFNERCV